MIALVDCNNFYVSCERVFAPHLQERPVVVLSNNDGCIVSRSAEAKALGIGMAVPYFQAKPLIDAHGVAVFSSNYALYGDMSARVMGTLARFAPKIEVYSIDEAFLDLSVLPPGELVAHCAEARRTVQQWTGIPVSVGVGRTKVLAKLANRLAKRSAKAQGLLVLQARHEEAALRATAIGEVWGIGWRYAEKCREWGIATAWDLAQREDGWVRDHLTVVGLRLVRELRGQPCLDLADGPGDRKQVLSSRSFGHPVADLPSLREAVSEYASRCAAKLRAQACVAGYLAVSVSTGRYGGQGPVHRASLGAALPTPTADSTVLSKAAGQLVAQLFKPGCHYKKASVWLGELRPASGLQASLFAPANGRATQRGKLMAVLDRVNATLGPGHLSLAAEGIQKEWTMKQALLSPRRTTRWADLLVVGG
jgi:DNA polymerase V